MEAGKGRKWPQGPFMGPFLCADRFLCIASVFTTPRETDSVFIPILMMGSLRPREVKGHAQATADVTGPVVSLLLSVSEAPPYHESGTVLCGA